MGHMKATLPYGTIGDEFDGHIPATYRLPKVPTPMPVLSVEPDVTCPVCGENWDIAEFKCVKTHCADSTCAPAGHIARTRLYWCPCGAVWSPGETTDNGEYATSIWDQRPPVWSAPGE